MSYRILRFCSEALSSPDDVKKLKQILPESEYIAVFSEINGFSTHLTELANLANEASVDFDQKLIEFKKWLKNYINELAIKNLQHIQDSESNLVNLLLELKKNNNMNSQIIDHILGYAEIITSQIISIFLDVEYFPVHELIKTDGRFGHATIDEEMTKKNFEKIRIKQQIIVPGNIGTDSLNQITILGLHGADYTAAIFAYLENANEIEIWLTIMGVYTADPLILPSAKLIPHLQYDMLNELIENTGNRRIISRRAFNLLKQHNISIAFRDFKIPNLPNSTLINNQNVNEPFFLIINSLENNLFITTDKNLISSSDFYRIYNFLDQTHIIVNDLFFDNARVILKSHELKIINDISLIFIVSNIIEKEGFDKIIELMKTNAIIVYSYVFQDSSLSSFLIIQQDRHELAIRLINEFLEKIYEQKH